MKALLFWTATLLMVSGCQKAGKSSPQQTLADKADAVHDFYDNAPTHQLPHPDKIRIDGEVAAPVNQPLEHLPLRSVIVKETRIKNQRDSFVGAYRYQGYSLYDLLKDVPLDKANKGSFCPIIDLYVTVTGKGGEKTVLSWGEIFYPVNRHQILIATRVTPVLPGKSGERRPVPDSSKLVEGTDLYSECNIAQPERICVHSLDADYPVKRTWISCMLRPLMYITGPAGLLY